MTVHNPYVAPTGFLLRDMLAMNAPPAPSWWTPNVQEQPEKPTSFLELGGSHPLRAAWEFWDNEGGENMPGDKDWPDEIKLNDDQIVIFKGNVSAWKTFKLIRNTISRQEKEGRIVQWPFVWADMMLAERVRNPGPAASLDGFQPGDRVTLRYPNGNGADNGVVCSLNFDDPTRPAIVVQQFNNENAPLGKPYPSDPELWREANATEH